MVKIPMLMGGRLIIVYNSFIVPVQLEQSPLDASLFPVYRVPLNNILLQESRLWSATRSWLLAKASRIGSGPGLARD